MNVTHAGTNFDSNKFWQWLKEKKVLKTKINRSKKEK